MKLRGVDKGGKNRGNWPCGGCVMDGVIRSLFIQYSAFFASRSCSVAFFEEANWGGRLGEWRWRIRGLLCV